MRKLAFLFAAALFVSAPLIAATPTLTYAAAKKKAATTKAPTAQPKRGAGGREEITDLNEVNTRFLRALNDLAIRLSKPWPTAEERGAPAGGGGARTAKAPKGKKGRA
jgi:hypothetical protein